MAQVQSLIENAVMQVAKQMEDQVDNQIQQLETMDEDDLEKLRAKRLEHMKRQADKRQEWLARGHGEVKEASNEKEIFELMKNEERMIVHFFKSNLACKVMDQHLGVLAKRHLETLFIKIDAEKAPFLTAKLKVWMLPTLALIKDQKVADYVVGFDELGGTYDFDSDSLEDRLAVAGAIFESVVPRRTSQLPPEQRNRSVRQGRVKKTDSDEDSDFD